MILYGKEIKEKMQEELKQEVTKIKDNISFVIIQVGDNFASNKYINNKINYAKNLGIDAIHLKYSEDVQQEELLNKIEELNQDKNINGVIVQLPLPKHLDEKLITQAIDYKKDIDGFNIKNIGKAYLNEDTLVSCTAQGIVKLLDYYNIEIAQKNITIAGRSNLVGKILALLLINKGATVTVCNSKTKNIENFINNSDIFISAIGVANHFDSNFINNDKLTVIDVGINFLDNKMVGDVNFDDVKDKVQNITPVPGGVGVLTVVQLMENIIKAYKIQKEI